MRVEEVRENPPTDPALAVTLPTIVALFATTAPPELTVKLPLPILSEPPEIVAPERVPPEIVPLALMVPLKLPPLAFTVPEKVPEVAVIAPVIVALVAVRAPAVVTLKGAPVLVPPRKIPLEVSRVTLLAAVPPAFRVVPDNVKPPIVPLEAVSAPAGVTENVEPFVNCAPEIVPPEIVPEAVIVPENAPPVALIVPVTVALLAVIVPLKVALPLLSMVTT